MLVSHRTKEEQTLHRPSSSGAAKGVDRGNAPAVHADSQIGPAPGAAPRHDLVPALLFILAWKSWVCGGLRAPETYRSWQCCPCTFAKNVWQCPMPEARASDKCTMMPRLSGDHGTVRCSVLGHRQELTSLYVYLTRPLGRPAARVARCAGFGARRLRSRAGRSPFSSACSFSAYASSLISTAVQHSPC